MKKSLLSLILLCSLAFTNAQLLTFTPDFPLDNSNLVITMDAEKGNKGLLGFAGPVYVHVGVITNLSSGPSDWKYVPFAWATSNPAAQAVSAGTNKWTYTINNIRTFFNVPPGETILRVNILFRNAAGTLVQRNIDGSDMYLPVYAAGAFAVRFTLPPLQPTYNMMPEPINVSVPANIPVTAVASKNANIIIRYNGTQIGSATAAQTASGTANITTTCEHQLTIEANDNGNIIRDTINFFIPPVTYPTAARPAGRRDGITFENNNTEAVFILYAPLKNRVSIIGDFNNWTQTCAGLLQKDGDYFWTRVTGLTAGNNYRYQYIVDDSIRVADPYSELLLDPSNDQFISATTFPNRPAYPAGKTSGGFVGVITPGETPYNWTSNSYVRPDKKDLMIYLLLMRDFTEAQNWQTLKDTLNYIKTLGFNAIKILPFNEFDGNISWGYNPCYFFAPDKAYGTKNALKAMIDQAHNMGIAVIQDVALNHATGQSPLAAMWWNSAASQPAANNPYFYQTAQHPFNVFNDFNHNSEATKLHVARFIRHWLTEYRIDGFRWDLSKGFTNQNCGNNQGCWDAFNQDRINIWKRYNDSMQNVSPGSYCILEHFAASAEDAELARNGMLLWGNMNYNFTGNVKGNAGEADINNAFWINRWGSTNLTDKPGLITFAESHDEERVIYNTQNSNTTNTSNSAVHNPRDLNTALRRKEAMAAILMGLPGPKMIWQFGELGYDFSINRCTNGTINNGCRLDPKPIRWDYYQVLNRRRLFETYAAMAKLRQQKPVTFRTPNLANGTNLGGSLVKTVVVDHADLKYVIVANFDVFQQSPNVTFPATGTWYNYTQGGSISVSGATFNVVLPPGEFRVFLDQNIAGGIVTSIRDVIANSNEFKLGVYPNPVQQTSFVRYELPKSGQVTLRVMNIQGQVLATKNMGFQLKGLQVYELNKNDVNGAALKAGQYVLQVRVDNIVRYEKLIVQQ
ncbi:MAG: T9SS type A sorting domain-containing protein [Chitinophagaceae bacterium]|nr:T9SS type A sorting domain-containing protein [Chitinophagaceae bacterium]